MTPAPATRLRVHLYTISWNEEAMLGFFFRHYDPWVSRYVFHDDGSTDRTLEILSRHPRVEIRPFRRVVPDSFVLSACRLHNEVWKESVGEADWVVITAVDEHLHHPDLPGWLEAQHAAGVTLLPALGYEMASTHFPDPSARLCDSLTMGVPFGPMSKPGLFRPDALRSTRFGPGRHRASPEGRVIYPARDELRLLHYKFLGDAYAKRRQALLARGLGAHDVEQGFGRQYHAGGDAIDARLADLLQRAIDVADRARDHHAEHRVPRWWRPEEFPFPAGPAKPSKG